VTDLKIQLDQPKTEGDIATRPPVPPFTRETAIQKARLAEDGWNSRDPGKATSVYNANQRSQTSTQEHTYLPIHF
jgi:hypothetical protein